MKDLFAKTATVHTLLMDTGLYKTADSSVKQRPTPLVPAFPYSINLTLSLCKGDITLRRKTLDNKDLNQVVAPSGFSESNGLVGMLSLMGS